MSEQQSKSPFAFLPAPVQAALARVRDFVKSLSIGMRVLVFSGLGLVLVAGAVMMPRALSEPYTTLFSQLEASDSGAVVAKLKELKVPYRISEGGSSIEVPEKKVHDVRLELAGAGLPRGGGVGFESFDKMRLGATDFEQRVMYRRALEGELARTIGNLGAVQSARVHLVLPEKSVFVSKNEPASASIVVKLRPGRALGAGEIAGIVHLTASSTPGLAPDRITLLSADGAVLHKPRRGNGEGNELDPESFGQARGLEASLEDRARTMLERIVGPGRADIRVSAELDLARVERTEDRFDPVRSVLRSEERSVERAGGVDESVAGVPGAEANLPSGAARGAGATAGSAAPAGSSAPAAPVPSANAALANQGTTRESHTRNFEVDRITEKRVMNGGTIKRLTVAVVVDGANGAQGAFVPRSKEELEKIGALVRSAVGVHENRGDSLTVESVPFAPSTDALADVNASTGHAGASWSSVMAMAMPHLKKKPVQIGLGVFGALVALMVLRGRMRRRKKVKAAATDALLAAAVESTLGLPAPAAAAELAPAENTAKAHELAAPPEDDFDARAEAQERAMRDPATAALVVRAWLGTSEIEERASA